MSTDQKVTKTQAAAIALISAAREMFPDLSVVVSAMDGESISTRFSSDCANVAALMLMGMGDQLENNIKSGVMHVHVERDELQQMPADTALHH